MLRSRCRGVRRADCRRQGILRGCRRQIARGCPVAVLASARSRRLPDLTPGGLWTSPPLAADGTRGRTGREDGALGAISSRASRDNPRRHPPPSAKTASTACAVPGLLQRSVPAGLRFASSLTRCAVHGMPGRNRRLPSGTALGRGELLRAAKVVPRTSAGVPGRAPWGAACGVPARPHPPRLAVPGHVHPSSTGAASAMTRRAAPGSRSGRRRARRPAAACPPGLHAASRHPSDGVGHRQRTLDPDTMLMSRPEITRPFTRPGERRPIRRQQRPVDDRLAATRTAATAGEDDLTPVPDDVVEHRVGLHTPGHADLAATAQRSVARHVDRTR